MEVTQNHVRLTLVVSSLILSLSVAYYFIVTLPNEQALQRLTEESRTTRENAFKHELDCREQYAKLSKEFDNVISVAYSSAANVCMVTFRDPETQKETQGPLSSFGRADLRK